MKEQHRTPGTRVARAPDQQVKVLLKKRQTLNLLRGISSSTLHLRNALAKEGNLEELEVLNEYLRNVLLRVEESTAEGRLLR